MNEGRKRKKIYRTNMDGWLSPCNSIDFKIRMRKNFVFALLFGARSLSHAVCISLFQFPVFFLNFTCESINCCLYDCMTKQQNYRIFKSYDILLKKWRNFFFSRSKLVCNYHKIYRNRCFIFLSIWSTNEVLFTLNAIAL